VVMLSGANWSFIVGLGATQIVDVIARELGPAGKMIGFGMDLAIAGSVVFVGWLALQRHNWAFILGMVLYLFDGLIFLLAGDMIAFGFHAFVLFCLFQGYKANRELQQAAAFSAIA